jgi:hypothetical protein
MTLFWLVIIALAAWRLKVLDSGNQSALSATLTAIDMLVAERDEARAAADQIGKDYVRVMAERDEARAEAHDATVLLIHRTRERDEVRAALADATGLDLDWERLRAGEIRALNFGHQDVFDAYAALWAERDTLRAALTEAVQTAKNYYTLSHDDPWRDRLTRWEAALEGRDE